MPATTMDGTEQILFEYIGLAEFAGHIFLDKMEEGDSIIIRLYIKDEENGTYKLYDECIYTGVQDDPCIYVRPIIGKVGIRVTAQQITGTYKTITHQWFKR